MNMTRTWHFPLPRTHAGMLLGNGVFGAMLWGGGNALNITVNRADFWDHRGGKAWTDRMKYSAIRALLKAGDEEALRELFEAAPPPAGSPPRPTVLPFGRIELRFPAGTAMREGTLDMRRGRIALDLGRGRGRPALRAAAEMSADSPLLLVQLPPGVGVEIHRVPAWAYVGEHLKSMSFKPPALFDGPDLSGWVQARPADDAACLGCRRDGRNLWLALVYGETADAARANATTAVRNAMRAGPGALGERNRKWWSAYWDRTPEVHLPNDRLDFIYAYGMYKFAGLTAPQGVAATLQGPWVEEYQMPPWSSDYHFNINVQECYWPAYQGNHLAHLRPMLDLVWSWRDKLRQNARLFLGIDDGYMLPHAVDDRCTCMGGFWTGTVDHGCTAWVAKMMYDYWRYGGDTEYLRAVAYPFMKGAMRVYEAMIERAPAPPPQPDARGPAGGGAPAAPPAGFALPVGVSPEYRGAAMNAWGRNASFQLAAAHWLIEALQRAAAALGETPSPAWREIAAGLPRACLQSPQPGGGARIVLWEGTDLEESHRHHSHLAGFYPFDTIDLADPEWRQIATNTYRWWQRQGMGLWTGWCVPWAAMLQSRIGLPDLAETLLEYWQALFTNEGHGTLHDPLIWGLLPTSEQRAAQGGPVARGFGRDRGEVMQIEAGMAAAAAVLDMLVHVRRGVHHLFPGAPARWRDASFRGILTEGGFLISAARAEGTVRSVEVASTIGGEFRLANPWGAARCRCRFSRKGTTVALEGETLAVQIPKRETACITPLPARPLH